MRTIFLLSFRYRNITTRPEYCMDRTSQQRTDESLYSSQSVSSLANSQKQHELQTVDETDKKSMVSSRDDCEFAEELHASDINRNGKDGSKVSIDQHLNEYDVNGGAYGTSGRGKAERTMTLLPPPPSWFQFEDMPKSLPNEHLHSTQTATRKSHTRRFSSGDADLSSKIFSATEQRRAVLDGDEDHQVKSNDTCLESSEELTEDHKLSSQFDAPSIPEFNSTERQMFDLPVLCAYTHDGHIPEESLSDSLTTQSAIDILISQTLSFTSQAITKTIPTLLHECSSSAIQKALHKLRIEYARFGPRKYLRASDLGSVGGYFRPSVIGHSNTQDDNSVFQIESSVALGKGEDNHFDWMWMDGREVRFTNLSWIERQLVNEWRTYEWTVNDGLIGSHCVENRFYLNSSIELDNNNVPSTECIRDGQKDQSKSVTEDRDSGVIFSKDEDEFNQIDCGEYELARTLAPRPLPRPEWEQASTCYICQKTFGHTLHRHHCRRCGHSFCNTHSKYFHKLPHLGYDNDVHERVCRGCKVILDCRDLEERVAWRLARCRDFLSGTLIPYFETGVDTVEDAAFRLTTVAIRLARSVPLGAQAYVAIETVEILRKHGLSGVYGLLLRKEFLAAADLLCRVLGIDKKNWPLSVHELSAAIFYALAQHRALRGLRPDGEELIHSLKEKDQVNIKESTIKRIGSLYVVNKSNVIEEDAGDTVVWEGPSSKLPNEFTETVLDETDVYDPTSENAVDLILLSHPKKAILDPICTNKINDNNLTHDETPSDYRTGGIEIDLPFEPVCEQVPDGTLSALLFYAPLALNFIYAECEVDMQLLAAQQGWRLLYASLDQNQLHSNNDSVATNEIMFNSGDKPASALFAHDKKRIACLSVRGTTSIQDVVTDIRAIPVPFPQENEEENIDTTDNAFYDNDEWTSVFQGKGLASCGMADAALNLFRENADSLTHLARNGYRIRIVGHSLGGGVATLLGILMSHHLEKLNVAVSCCDGVSTEDDRLLRVYGYGTPSCVDGSLADYTRAYATNVVLHDDVVPRLTPTSIRSLLKHLLHIRETWVKAHLSNDLKCYHERAYKVWPSRVRESFSLSRKVLKNTKKKLKKSYTKRMQKSRCNVRQVNDCIENHTYKDGATEDRTYDADEGFDVEGDLFFDALNDEPLNESDDESSIERSRPSHLQSNTILVECKDEWVPFDEPPMMEPNGQNVQDGSNNDEYGSTIDSSQILEELPLPRMFIPGKICHIYTYRGGYKAAFVPRKFKSLRRISMAGNCLTDHMAKSYYESMLEVSTIRSAKYELPQWVGFDQDCTCACCASLFTWASTSNTEAQAARDKHNCRSCGALVCDPCSKNKAPIPSVGITQSVRVCDRCYNGWGSLYNDLRLDKNNRADTSAYDNNSATNKSSVTQMRRSYVVDELVARLPTVTR